MTYIVAAVLGLVALVGPGEWVRGVAFGAMLLAAGIGVSLWWDERHG